MQNKENIGLAVIISGPSGVGKGTIIQNVLKDLPGFELAISSSTRKPRAGEEHGKHYHFISGQEFDKKVAEGRFAEWALVHGNYYGTSIDYIESLGIGKNIIFEIDVQGAIKLIELLRIKNNIFLSVFLAPPNIDDLMQRMESRGTETRESMEIRYQNAKEEMKKSKYFDKIVINDNISKAVNEILSIINKRRNLDGKQI